MTDFPIDPSTRRSGPYTATAAQTVFDYGFPVLDADDLGVYRLPNGGTTETRLARGTDYTVTGVGLEAGGTIVLTAPAAAGDRITIVGERTPRRLTDFGESGALTAAALNLEFDALAIQSQEQAAQTSRTLRLPDGDPDADMRLPLRAQRLGRFLRFDPSTGQPTVFDIATLGAVALPLTLAQGGTGATDAAAARNNLGVVAASETVPGLIEIATAAETTAGVDDARAITPKKLTEFAPAAATIDAANDQVLFRDVSDGNKLKRGALPTLGGLTLLATAAPSGVAAVDFTSGISATYDEYVITFEKVIPATNDVVFLARISTDGGSTWQSTSYLCAGHRWNTGGAGAEARTDGIALSPAQGAGQQMPNATADGGVSGELRFWPNGTAGKKMFLGRTAHIYSSASNMWGFQCAAAWNGGNGAINAVRFLMSAGNIASGNFRLYGVQRS